MEKESREGEADLLSEPHGRFHSRSDGVIISRSIKRDVSRDSRIGRGRKRGEHVTPRVSPSRYLDVDETVSRISLIPVLPFRTRDNRITWERREKEMKSAPRKTRHARGAAGENDVWRNFSRRNVPPMEFCAQRFVRESCARSASIEVGAFFDRDRETLRLAARGALCRRDRRLRRHGELESSIRSLIMRGSLSWNPQLIISSCLAVSAIYLISA